MLGTVNFITASCAWQQRDWCGAARVSRCPSGSTPAGRRRGGGGGRTRCTPCWTPEPTRPSGQGFPHGIGGADDVIAMPLQCSTQWDGLGHIFDHGNAWNGRRAGDRHLRRRPGDGHREARRPVCGRGVLLDVARMIGADGARRVARRLRDHAEHLTPPPPPRAVAARPRRPAARAHRPAAPERCREGWGDYAGGASPGLSFTTAGWLHRTEIAAIATDTWGFEVRPTSSTTPSSRCTRSPSRTWACSSGRCGRWTLSADCAADGVYEFFLTAAPLPITGAVGSPVNPIAVK